MNNKIEVITGTEQGKNIAAPLATLIAFYKVFNARDALAAANNWSKTESIAMDNPIGGIRRSWDDIRQGYEKIMNGNAKVYVEFYDYTQHQSGSIFYVEGRERGQFSIGDNMLDLKIRTSRIYKLTCGQWKQVHHHGSIEEPALLEKYKTAISGMTKN